MMGSTEPPAASSAVSAAGVSFYSMSLIANHSYDLHADVGGRLSTLRSYRACAPVKERSSRSRQPFFLVSRPPSPLEFHCNFCLCVAMNELGGEPLRERALGRRSILRSTLAPLLGSPSIILSKNVLKLPHHIPHEASILHLVSH